MANKPSGAKRSKPRSPTPRKTARRLERSDTSGARARQRPPDTSGEGRGGAPRA